MMMLDDKVLDQLMKSFGGQLGISKAELDSHRGK